MPKKKKKSKAELEAERLQREEEERQEREAELKRQEEERIEREKREKQRQEEMAHARREELERFKQEAQDDAPLVKARAEARAAAETEDREAAEWRKYVDCSPLPDPSVEADLNTYIDTWRATEEPKLDSTIASCIYAERIVAELLKVMAKATAEGDALRLATCVGALSQLWQIASRKLDVSTRFMMDHAHEILDADEGGNKAELKLEQPHEALKFGLWLNIAPKTYRLKNLRFEELGIDVDVPKSLAMVPVALRAQYFPLDHEHFSRIASAACVDRALGGVLLLELLALPDPPKRVRGWTMRVSRAGGGGAGGEGGNAGGSEGEGAGGEGGSGSGDGEGDGEGIERLNYPLGHEGLDPPAAGTAHPLRVEMPLPPGVVMPEGASPRIGWWDPRVMAWNEDGVSDVVFDPERRTVEFHTLKLTTLAVLQHRRCDLPFRGWSLAPSPAYTAGPSSAPPEAVLTLRTPRFELAVAVREGECQLLHTVPEMPELTERLGGEAMPPGLLLQRLDLAGINVVPRDEDAAAKHEGGAPSVLKVPALEAKAEAELAAVATAFEAQGSAWNQGAGAEQITFFVRAAEVAAAADAAPEEEDDEKREAVLFEVDAEAPAVGDSGVGAKCSVVTVDGAAEQLSVDAHENRQRTSIGLQGALARSPACTAEAKDRLLAATPRFTKTVEDVLRLVRVFSFA